MTRRARFQRQQRPALHVAICIPAESMPIESVRSLTAALSFMLTAPPAREFAVSQHYFASSMLPYARAKVCESAIRAGASHLLLLDSDMTYPRDVAHRLLEGLGQPQARGIVAANATTRRPPIRWVARGADGEPIDSGSRAERWTIATTCGVAVAMLEAELYRKLPSPRFAFAYTDRGWIGEDIWLCRLLAARGCPPLIDNALSREVGHVGTREYGAADVEGVDEPCRVESSIACDPLSDRSSQPSPLRAPEPTSSCIS